MQLQDILKCLFLAWVPCQAVFFPSSFGQPEHHAEYIGLEKINFSGRNEQDSRISSANEVEVPEDIFTSLKEASDLSAVTALLGIKEESQQNKTLFYSPRIGDRRTPSLKKDSKIYGRGRDETVIENPQQAHCEPELKAVELDLESTPGITHYPSCIRLNRCGGCCQNKALFSCQPIASKTMTVKVIKLWSNQKSEEMRVLSRGRRRGGRRRTRATYEFLKVPVEEHTKCECMCKLKESDCDLRVHTYVKETCSCVCSNGDEEQKCYKRKTHYWDKSSCQCLCREVQPCTTGESFDHTKCGCVSNYAYGSLHDILRSSKHAVNSTRIRKPIAIPLK